MRIHYLFEDAKPGFLKAQDNPDFPYMNSASQRFAGTYPGQILASAGHDVSYHFSNPHTGARTDINFQEGDIVVGIRNYYEETAQTMIYAQSHGAITIVQMNDPHILSTDDSLKQVRDVHHLLLTSSDGVIACSPKLAELSQNYNPQVAVIYDGVDTRGNAPNFDMTDVQNGSRPLRVATACYAHNHGDIVASLASLDHFSQVIASVEYHIVTKGARADQGHHGNDFDRLLDYASQTGSLKVIVTPYSPLNAASAIESSDIVLIQGDAGKRSGYKAAWYPNKSNGRGAASIHAGKPFFCPDDILAYQPFLNRNGGYNIKNDMATTLNHIMTLPHDQVNQDIVAGQGIIKDLNSDEALARAQFDFFSHLREKKGFFPVSHGLRP